MRRWFGKRGTRNQIAHEKFIFHRLREFDRLNGGKFRRPERDFKGRLDVANFRFPARFSEPTENSSRSYKIFSNENIFAFFRFSIFFLPSSEKIVRKYFSFLGWMKLFTNYRFSGPKPVEKSLKRSSNDSWSLINLVALSCLTGVKMWKCEVHTFGKILQSTQQSIERRSTVF